MAQPTSDERIEQVNQTLDGIIDHAESIPLPIDQSAAFDAGRAFERSRNDITVTREEAAQFLEMVDKQFVNQKFELVHGMIRRFRFLVED